MNKKENKMATTKNEDVINIVPIKKKYARVRIVGTSPIIIHAWSEKAKREMLEAQQKITRTKSKREPKRPFEDFVNSLYWLTEKPTANTDEELAEKFDKAIQNGARFGFPANSIKIAANSGAFRLGWVSNKMGLRGAYFVRGVMSDGSVNGEFIEIRGDIPTMREDMVTIGKGGTDIRYRGEFKNWYSDIEIEYNASGDVTLEQIINCLNAGGYAAGIGEWRPEKDGHNGMFEVARTQ